MWRVNIGKALREVRFVMRVEPEHHGVWQYWKTQVPLLRILNPNAQMCSMELAEEYATESAVHFIFGDTNDTEISVPTAGLSAAEFETILKEKIAYGLSLDHHVYTDNKERGSSLPTSIVVAGKYRMKTADDFSLQV